MSEQRVFVHPILKELFEFKPTGSLSHPILKELLEKKPDFVPKIHKKLEPCPITCDETWDLSAEIEEIITKWNDVLKVHKSLEGTTCKAVTGMEKSADKDKLICVKGSGWFLSDKIGNLDQFLKDSDFTKEKFDEVVDPLLLNMRKSIDIVLDQNSGPIIETMIGYFNFLLKFHDLILENYCINKKIIPKSPLTPKFGNCMQRIFSQIIHARNMIMPGDVAIICRNILYGTNKRLKSDKRPTGTSKVVKPNITLLDALKKKYKKRNIMIGYRNTVYDCVFTYIVGKARKSFVLLDSVDDFDVNIYRNYQDCGSSYTDQYDLIYVFGKSIMIDTTRQTAHIKGPISDTTLATLIKHFGNYCEKYEQINDLIEALY